MLSFDFHSRLLKDGAHQRDLLVEKQRELAALEEDILDLIFLDLFFPARRLGQPGEKVFPEFDDFFGDPGRSEKAVHVIARSSFAFARRVCVGVKSIDMNNRPP